MARGFILDSATLNASWLTHYGESSKDDQKRDYRTELYSKSPRFQQIHLKCNGSLLM